MKSDASPPSIELAAGGLVWSSDTGKKRLAVVRRSQYGDWVLPKGRLQSNETADQAALREVMEETRQKADLGMWAGSYSYQKNDRPKVVLMWEVTALPDPYDHPAPSQEIAEVAWLTPVEAMIRLTHSSEREFLARHLASKPGGQLAEIDPGETRPKNAWRKKPRQDRLRAAVQSLTERYAAMLEQSPNGADAWWARSAARSLSQARASVAPYHLDVGWGALHNAERAMVFGMNHRELLARAATLYSETQRKLKGWRRTAAEALLNPFPLDDWNKTELEEAQKPSLQYATVEAMRILYENSDNSYHLMGLVEKQLGYLVTACAALLALAFAASLVSLAWGADPTTKSSLHIGNLLAVALAGALGGAASAMSQLSRIGRARIPEGLLHGLVTSGRPLVGAVFALFVYVVMKSNVVGFISIQNPSLEAGLALGFVAGFSERLVISTVSRVAGQDPEKPGA